MNNMNPGDNHYDDFIEEKEEQEDVANAQIEELEPIEDEQNNRNKESKEQYRAKMVKLFGLVIVIFIIVILFGFIFSLFGKKKYDYLEVENIMRDAAISYFKDNTKNLPKFEKTAVEIHDDVLSDEGYMKKLSDLIKDENCSGKVVVKKIKSKEYSYTAYLDCGSGYKTRELYKEIVDKKNIVTSGYGIYEMNNEYVYRGKNVKNYVRFKDSKILWRIVKVTANNEIALVQAFRSNNSYAWDTRYNSVFENNSGINVFDKSEMSNVLRIIYKGYFGNEDDKDYYDVYFAYDGEKKLLTKNDKTKLVKYNACVGPRSNADTSRDGSSECSVTSSTYFGLLPVYDFLNASIDPACTTTISPECQNYNYLSSEDDANYWLGNGNVELSNKVYNVTGEAYVGSREASSTSYVKGVIHLSDMVMIESGKGTLKDPFVIR